MDVCGAEWPSERDGLSIQPQEGCSLRDTFDSEVSDRPPLAWEHEGNCAYREGKWKLVKRWDRDDWELYDMDVDRTELNDLSAEHPELHAELKVKYDAWASRVGVIPWDEIEAGRNAQGIYTDWMPHPHD